MTCEECILSIKSDGSNCPFDGVDVHIDPAVAGEQDQLVPESGDVTYGFT